MYPIRLKTFRHPLRNPTGLQEALFELFRVIYNIMLTVCIPQKTRLVSDKMTAKSQHELDSVQNTG